MHEPIYLDYNATTPPAAEVIDAMGRALAEDWGNPSSAHAYGRRARAAVDRARAEVAALLGCETDEVVFTGGGTESDNAAIVGIAEALASRGRRIVTSNVEHPAVDRACSYLERRGWTVTRVAVDGDGRVAADAVAAAVGSETTVVTVMHAQNESGVLQPIAAIAAALAGRGVILHSDTAQSVGKIPVTVDDLGVDALTVAGHKLYGPQGVGALYLRRGTPFSPFLHGAGHEAGRRAGTENVAAIVGLGAACRLARREIGARAAHLSAMRDRLEQRLRERLPDLVVHGAGVERLPNTLFVALPGADATALLARVDGVAAAAGAACEAGKSPVSATLRAMGVPDELAVCTLRLTVGRTTGPDEIDTAVDRLGAAAEALHREAARQ